MIIPFRTQLIQQVLARVEPSAAPTLRKLAAHHEGDDASLAQALIEAVPLSPDSYVERGKIALAVLDEYNQQPEVPLVMKLGLEAAQKCGMSTSRGEIAKVALQNLAASSPIGVAGAALQMIDAIAPQLLQGHEWRFLPDQSECGVAALEAIQGTDIMPMCRRAVAGALERIEQTHPSLPKARLEIAVETLKEVIELEQLHPEVARLAHGETSIAIGDLATVVVVGGVPLRRRDS